MKTERNPRGAGRKPAASPKTVRVTIRVSEETRKEWADACERNKLTLTAMIELAVKKLGE